MPAPSDLPSAFPPRAASKRSVISFGRVPSDKSLGIDTITDFANKPGDDDGFTLFPDASRALGKSVTSGEFVTVASGHDAKDENDHLIYNKSDGTLWFDADGSGSGAAIHFATLSNHAALTYHDFSVFAP